MIELIISIDNAVFLFINSYLSNPVFDFIMPLFHHTKFFIPIMLLPWLIAIWKDKNNRWKLTCLIPIAIILVDQTGLFIKETILRPRPSMVMDSNIINNLVNHSGNNLSFPSNHAANTAVLATIFSSIYYRYRFIFWSVAITVAFSRVYIGVHYPLDILSGCILGTVYGILIVFTWNFYSNKYYKKTQNIN